MPKNDNNDVPKAPLVVERINTTRKTSTDRRREKRAQWEKDVASTKKSKPIDPTKPKKITKRNFDPLQPDLWFVKTHSDIMFPNRTREQALPILDSFLIPGENKYARKDDDEPVWKWKPTKTHNWIPRYMIHYFSSHQPQRATMKMVVAWFNTVLIPDMQQGKIPTLEWCWMSIWISPWTLADWYSWTNEDKSPYFSEDYIAAYKQCMKLQRDFIVQSCALWTMNMNFGKYLLSALHWMNEKTINETVDLIKKDEIDRVKKILDDPNTEKAELKDAKDIYLSMLWRV